MSNSNNLSSLKHRTILFVVQIFTGIALLAAILTSLPAFARAGTLLKCDFINTPQGGRYIGTYCVDYNCQYVERHVFTSYCPFMKP